MPETRIRVTTTIDAAPGFVFDLLASPHRHRDIDASGMVGTDEFDEPITKAGQVFRMNMRSEDDGVTSAYQTDNLVTKFKANRKLAWAVAEVDGDPYGWTWRYDLSPKGKHDQKTLVTLTYEWADTSPDNVKRFGVPCFDAADLEASLKLLATAVRRGR